MYTFDSQYETYLSEFNAYAEAYCKTLRTKPEVLGESMKYSLLLGGKRTPLFLRSVIYYFCRYYFAVGNIYYLVVYRLYSCVRSI